MIPTSTVEDRVIVGDVADQPDGLVLFLNLKKGERIEEEDILIIHNEHDEISHYRVREARDPVAGRQRVVLYPPRFRGTVVKATKRQQ